MNKSLKAKWHGSIEEIPKENWETLLDNKNIPFFHWNWLYALENSESISRKFGWQPIHLTLWDNNRLIAFAPLYLKNHSYGEFIFDQPFANLANQINLQYYPKLIGMSPLSPIEGYKFFISNQEDEGDITKIIMRIIDDFAIKNRILSCNFLYVDQHWKKFGEAAQCSCWINKQSLWNSKGESSFEEYLAKFNSNQRRNIKREKKSIEQAGLQISILNGKEIDLELIQLMYNLYELHCRKWGAWGSKYLTKDFFKHLLNDSLRENILLFNANRGNIKEPVAMSLFITNWEILWGRYWGSNQEIKNLHFDLCYYSPISWAIKNGITIFDPGAGGSHKLRRGFSSIPRFSLHRWYNSEMESLIKAWLPKINHLMIQEINASNNEVPFKDNNKDLK